MKKVICMLSAILFAGILCTQLQARTYNPLYEKGYKGFVDFATGYHTQNYNGLQASMLIGNGYSTGFGLYTGLGTGIEWSPNYQGAYLSVPIYLDLKYSFFNDDFSPYVAMKCGYNISFNFMRGGVYLAPSVGVDIRRHLSLFLKYDYTSASSNALKFKKSAYSVGLAIGF